MGLFGLTKQEIEKIVESKLEKERIAYVEALNDRFAIINENFKTFKKDLEYALLKIKTLESIFEKIDLAIKDKNEKPNA